MGSLRTRPGPFAIMTRSPSSSIADDDAVVRSVDAAVQRIERRAVGVEADDEAVGARRRPGLDDAHRLDMRALHRLLERHGPNAGAARSSIAARSPPSCAAGRPARAERTRRAGCARRRRSASSRRRRPATGATDRRADGAARRVVDPSRATAMTRWRQLSLTRTASPAAQRAEGEAKAAGERLHRPGRRVEQEDPAAAPALQEVPVAHCVDAAGRRSRRSRSASPSGAGASALTALSPVAKTACGFAADGVGIDADLLVRRARRRGRRPAGRRAPRSAGRSRALRSRRPRRAAEASRRRRGQIERPSVARSSGAAHSRMVSACSSFWFGFKRAVERRHRDGRVAPAEEAVGEFPERRRSREPSPALLVLDEIRIGAVELVAADAIVGDAAEIEIAAMFAHRCDHRMIDAAGGPRASRGSRPSR